MQLLSLISGLVVVVLLLGDNYAKIAQFLAKMRPTSLARAASPMPPKTVNASIVNDMVLVAELRDRLEYLNCAPGGDACTALLRVMVEFKYKRG